MPLICHARLCGGGCSQSVYEPSDDPDATAELTASVGEKGRNLPDDVRAVQDLLNGVGPNDGGPSPPLDVDGLCGPLTKRAILKFQQRYFRELLGDGRIDPGKNTWKKLIALSEGSGVREPRPPQGPKPITPQQAASRVADAELRTRLLFLLAMTQSRIYPAIHGLDVARAELDACERWKNLAGQNAGLPSMTLFEAYTDLKKTLTELPTVDRCFHVMSPSFNVDFVDYVIGRIRKIYETMLQVIATTVTLSPDDKPSGKGGFIRIVTQQRLDADHPKSPGAHGDAVQGGWWLQNPKKGNIRIADQTINGMYAITTLIHEMSHFVASPTTYVVAGHKTGQGVDAFNEPHDRAVRNAFCYEWYALLAVNKALRASRNIDLQLC